MTNLSLTTEDLTLTAAVNDKHKARVKRAGDVVALTAITFASIMPLAALASLSIHMTSICCGIPLLTFYDANFGATPALIMLFCYAGILRSFFLDRSSRAATVARVALAGFIFVACASTGPVALFYFFAGLMGWFGACKLGRAMRSALPETFRFDRALASLFVGSLPSLGYMTAINLGLLHPHSPMPGATAHFTPLYMISVAAVMTLSLGLQGFLLAKCARTGDARPVVLLSVLLASPILLTTLLLPLSAAFCGELSACTLPLFIASLAAALTGISATASGAWAGAKSNAANHELIIQSKHSLSLDNGKF